MFSRRYPRIRRSAEIASNDIALSAVVLAGFLGVRLLVGFLDTTLNIYQAAPYFFKLTNDGLACDVIHVSGTAIHKLR